MRRPAGWAAGAALLLATTQASAAGFKWRPWARLQGHTDDVRALVFSLDGRTLVSAGDDERMVLWDVEARKERVRLVGHKDAVRALALDPEARLLASGSEDDTVRLWSLTEGRELATLKGHDDGVLGLDFSADGGTLASGSVDRTVRLWDMRSQEPLGVLKGHSGAVHTVRFNPEGRLLSSASSDKTLRTWDYEGRKEVRSLVEASARWGDLFAFAFHPDGRLTATVIKEVTRASGMRGRRGGISEADFIQLRDGKTGEERGRLSGHLESIAAVAFSPDGRYLASGSYDHSVMVWDVQTLQRASVVNSHGPVTDLDRLYAVAFSPNGRFLAAAGPAKTVYVWEVQGVETVPAVVSGEGRYRPPRLSLPDAPSGAKRARVAVLDLACKGKVEPWVGEVLADTVRTGLLKTGRYELVDRGNLEKVIREQELAVSDLVDASTTVELGKLTGAEALVTGSVARLGKTWAVNLSLTSVSTGKVDAAGRESCPCEEDDLFLVANTAMLKLLGAR